MPDPTDVRIKYRKFKQLYPEYEEKLETDYLPFETHDVYSKWKPRQLTTLFIAESPSAKRERYFYDITCKKGLSEYIPKYLGITNGTKIQQLEEFKRKGYFLTDIVSCIYTKEGRRIPSPLIEFSVKEILEPEIKSLHPKTIVILGWTALRGLRFIDEFRPALAGITSITKLERRKIRAGDTTLIVSIYPGDRTQRYHETIRTTFRLINA